MTSTHHRFKHNKELVGPGTIKFGRHVVDSDLLETTSHIKYLYSETIK